MSVRLLNMFSNHLSMVLIDSYEYFLKHVIDGYLLYVFYAKNVPNLLQFLPNFTNMTCNKEIRNAIEIIRAKVERARKCTPHANLHAQ